MDSVGEGEGGKIWENGIETCVISGMKRKKKYFEINGAILEMNVCNGCTTL